MEETKSGFMLIHKTEGPTSHDVIDELRKITGIKKIGHAGTLDPFASGLLLVAIGRQATKLLGEYVGLDKKYEAGVFLGAETDTYDKTAKAVKIYEGSALKLEQVEEVLSDFRGKIKQIPPMFSAKKINGQKLYNLARQGKNAIRQAVKIEIYDLAIIKYNWPVLDLSIHSSSGTYVRSLAFDIGRKLGCGAYLERLIRTEIGPYKLNQAIKISKLNQRNWANFVLTKL